MTINYLHDFRSRGGLWVVAQFALFGLILVALTADTTPSWWLRLSGWGLIVAAVALAGSGLWTIRRRLSALPAPLEGAVLMRRGPYRLVRHPIYGGLVIGAFGLAARGGNLAIAVLATILLGFFVGKSRYEERLLGAAFPGYRTYRAEVRHRLIPWLL
jgi:protein-S-isoprenylcysteine O-methyltransferase Ste14